jgi:DNA-damage-inducible protein J
MASDTVVRARIDGQVKERAAKVLADMGLSVSDAIRLFLARVAAEKALPFDIKVPNAETRGIPELSVVALRHSVECKGAVLPEGGKGTVVHVYHDGEYYEVEFAEPFPCTVTLRRGDIHPG